MDNSLAQASFPPRIKSWFQPDCTVTGKEMNLLVGFMFGCLRNAYSLASIALCAKADAKASQKHSCTKKKAAAEKAAKRRKQAVESGFFLMYTSQSVAGTALRRLWSIAVMKSGSGIFCSELLAMVRELAKTRGGVLPPWMRRLGLKSPLEGVDVEEHDGIWAKVSQAIQQLDTTSNGIDAGIHKARMRARTRIERLGGGLGFRKYIGSDLVQRSRQVADGFGMEVTVLVGHTHIKQRAAWRRRAKSGQPLEDFSVAEIQRFHVENFRRISVLGTELTPPKLTELLLVSMDAEGPDERYTKIRKLYELVCAMYHGAVRSGNPMDSGWGDMEPPDMPESGSFHTLSWEYIHLLLPFLALAWLEARREAVRPGRVEWVLEAMVDLHSEEELAEFLEDYRRNSGSDASLSHESCDAVDMTTLGGAKRGRSRGGCRTTRRQKVRRLAADASSDSEDEWDFDQPF